MNNIYWSKQNFQTVQVNKLILLTNKLFKALMYKYHVEFIIHLQCYHLSVIDECIVINVLYSSAIQIPVRY